MSVPSAAGYGTISRIGRVGKDSAPPTAAGKIIAAPPRRVMKSRRLMSMLQSEDHTLPHWCRECRVVHHSKTGPLMSEMGQLRLRPSEPMATACPQWDQKPTWVSRSSQCLCQEPCAAREKPGTCGARNHTPSGMVKTGEDAPPARARHLPKARRHRGTAESRA